MQLILTPESYDGVVSALTGNGVLCTTVCPSGYHVPPEGVDDQSHLTQHFVMAGRRRRGPQHPLVNFGTVSRTLRVGKNPATVQDWQQTLDVQQGVVISEWTYEGLKERTRSCILLQDNVFLADTVVENSSDREVTFVLNIQYAFGEADPDWRYDLEDDGFLFDYTLEEHQGRILLRSRLVAGVGNVEFESSVLGGLARLTATLAAGESIVLSTWLHFSDRLGFEFPVTVEEIDAAVDRHESGWADFWSRSEVITGDDTVDTFRQTSLYTLRCQCTPWSVPATLSSVYWGGGAFHDEMYPFFGLLSSNYPDLAERVPYFRLTTLPQARQRARGRGALYPWSSTEFGAERDPYGHWLTERFHLGQFAVCIQSLFLYEQRVTQLEDLYPVLRDLARHFEMDLIERDDNGCLGTRACTDFDESVGRVKNGPFTLNAAIATLDYAASAANRLGCDTSRAQRWTALARELRETQASSPRTLTDAGVDIYAIPEGKHLHYSILGPVFPFRVDVFGDTARRSAEHIHNVCRTARGWKPGFSEGFAEHSWMWMAAHLGIVHAIQEDAGLAWESIRVAPESAGAFLSPNEHRNRDDRVVVPWFTTGCGGWLYALNSLFVQVDEEGTKLLPAVPDDLPNVRFSSLRAEGGVLLSAAFSDGMLVTLTALSPDDHAWRYRLPERLIGGRRPRGTIVENKDGWMRIQDVKLPANEEVSLLE